jgi:hypothetical protein
VDDTAPVIIFSVALVVFLVIVVAILVTWSPPSLKRLTGWLGDL